MVEETVEFSGYTGQQYLTEVRRFVPGYDQMVKVVSNLIIESAPSNVLDVGSGVGTVDEAILSSLADAKMTCLEPAEAMAQATQASLKK